MNRDDKERITSGQLKMLARSIDDRSIILTDEELDLLYKLSRVIYKKEAYRPRNNGEER